MEAGSKSVPNYSRPTAIPEQVASTLVAAPSRVAYTTTIPCHSGFRPNDTADALPTAIIFNDRYVAEQWEAIRDQCENPMKFIIKKAKEAGHLVTPYPMEPAATC